MTSGWWVSFVVAVAIIMLGQWLLITLENRWLARRRNDRTTNQEQDDG